MKRMTIFVYGLICYLIGAAAYFVGLSGFLANLYGLTRLMLGGRPRL